MWGEVNVSKSLIWSWRINLLLLLGILIPYPLTYLFSGHKWHSFALVQFLYLDYWAGWMMWRLVMTFWKTKPLPVSLKFATFPSLHDQAQGGRCQRQLPTNVKALENMIPSLIDRWRFIPVFVFCKGSSIDCWWGLAQVTAPAGAPSQQGKNFFPLHSSILAGCETWTDALAGLQHPLTPSMVYFPILRNSASFPGRLKHVLDGFISWWWCTQAYPHMSCFWFKTFSYLIFLSTSLWQHCRDFHEWLWETSLITHRLTWKP